MIATNTNAITISILTIEPPPTTNFMNTVVPSHDPSLQLPSLNQCQNCRTTPSAATNITVLYTCLVFAYFPVLMAKEEE
jgi:hypothetical protein